MSRSLQPPDGLPGGAIDHGCGLDLFCVNGWSCSLWYSLGQSRPQVSLCRCCALAEPMTQYFFQVTLGERLGEIGKFQDRCRVRVS